MYGFGIVCFLTGIHWGTYLYKSDSSPDNLFITSNAVFLAVFFAFLLDFGALTLFVLLLAFLCVLYIDYRLLKAGLLDNDYFRLRAVFEPAINYKQWIQPAGRRISLMTDEDIVKANAIEAQAKVKVAERAKKQSEFMEAALQAELAKFDGPTRGQLEEAYRVAGDKRTDAQKALLEKHPSIGKLHPGIAKSYDIKRAVYLFELDAMKALASIAPAAEPISKFPAIRRDIAVIVDDTVTADELVTAVAGSAPKLIQDVRIFDIYRGAGIEAGRKSVAIGLILQETSRTLTDDDADTAMAAATSKLKDKFAAELRD